MPLGHLRLQLQPRLTWSRGVSVVAWRSCFQGGSAFSLIDKSKTACKAYHAVDVELGPCWPTLLFRAVQANVDPLVPFVIPTLLVTAV